METYIYSNKKLLEQNWQKIVIKVHLYQRDRVVEVVVEGNKNVCSNAARASFSFSIFLIVIQYWHCSTIKTNHGLLLCLPFFGYDDKGIHGFTQLIVAKQGQIQWNFEGLCSVVLLYVHTIRIAQHQFNVNEGKYISTVR